MRRVFVTIAATTFAMSASAQPTPDQARAFALARTAVEMERVSGSELWFTEALSIAFEQIDAGDAAGAQALITDMLREARQAENKGQREERLGYVAELQAVAGMAAESRATLRQIRDAPRQAAFLGRIAEDHAARGAMEAARATLADIPPGELRRNAISTAAQHAVNAGQFAAARALAAAFGAEFALASAEEMIAMHAARGGDAKTAREAMAGMSAEQQLGVLYELGCALLEAGKRDEARQLLLEARDAWRRIDAGFMRDLWAEMLAENLSAARAFEAALELVPNAEADERGELYQTISGDQAWAGLFDDAERTLALIRASESDRVVDARATIVAARVGHGLEKPDALMRMLSYDYLLHDAAAEAAERGMRDLARDVLGRAARIADDESRLATVEVQIELGFIEDARATAASIRRNDLRADAQTQSARALAARGERAAALEAFGEAQRAGRSLSPDDYAFITEEMAEAGLLAEALAAARALPSGDFDRDWARGRALRSVAVGYAKAGNADAAFEVVREMPRAQAEALLEVAKALPD